MFIFDPTRILSPFVLTYLIIGAFGSNTLENVHEGMSAYGTTYSRHNQSFDHHASASDSRLKLKMLTAFMKHPGGTAVSFQLGLHSFFGLFFPLCFLLFLLFL